MRAPLYSAEAPDGCLREAFVPWWWPMFLFVLRVQSTLTGAPIDEQRIERAFVRHARWRITPPGYRRH